MKTRARNPRGRFMPVVAATAVAALATAALFLFEFTPPSDAHTSPGATTAAAVMRAGATLLPTDPATFSGAD
ncbi:hypothetical protein [Bradyrhizobium lablabi]|uniref:hypothetical protein n=1 Tax=Bradyrhizobium lablabi TaxID=722472 RepID=UPI001BA6E50B|nr:hypothetical protein [Bradyrhizobium lablabi]MBR0692094.1 hypothetical protein [Bradyrhizobium lablabi]